MSDASRRSFWQSTKRWTAALLAAWLAVNLLVPWFARELDRVQGFGFPAGYWLAAAGALGLYLVIIVVYVVVMERLEARCLEGGADTPEPPAAGPP